MSTAAQIAANQQNAQSSTGPRTPEGKAASAKNSVTHGLFSGDFIRPGEEHLYQSLSSAVLRDFAPVGPVEDTFAEEIYRAMWRLRRCGEVESHFVIRLNDGQNFIEDPMEAPSPNCERIQHSVDRARAQAHRLLNKSIDQLRKLQSERKASPEHESSARKENEKSDPNPEEAPVPARSEPVLEPVEISEARRTQSPAPETPRNAQCPCGSGQKYKRCCGKEAPPVLHNAKQAA